jgi:tetratricopeptide (TPR) repeat protein
MAGVGKTQLAIRAAHLMLREQPFERVLFVNLRGFHPDPAQPPADPAAVLDGFLRLLDVPGHQMPDGLEARAEAYRRQLAGTRTLVILDNAADAGQVRPLLPGNPSCPVLVTSRRILTDLRGAAQLPVGVFTVDEALRFLREAAPEVPVGDDPEAAVRIALRCGHLPLALGLVAAQMRTRPGWTLTDHADWLDERHRDRRLVTGIELALDLSYRHLPAGRQRLLRLLASHPGQDFDRYAAAALADVDLDTAGSDLDDLCRDHLLLRGSPGRYAFHDLVHAFAANRAEDEDRLPERRAASTRLLDHYQRSATACSSLLDPSSAPGPEPVSAAGGAVVEPADRETALAWFTTEHGALLAAVDQATASGRYAQSLELARCLYGFLYRRGHWQDLVRVQRAAIEAARRLGDPALESRAHRNLAAAEIRLGRFREAQAHLRVAIELGARAGDAAAQAQAHYNMAYLWDQQRDYPAAVRENERAMAFYQAAGHRQGQARALGAAGWYRAQFGEHRAALETCLRAVSLFEEIGDRAGLASTLDTLGLAHRHLGELAESLACYRRAVEIHRDLDSRYYEGITLAHLGDTHLAVGDRDAARAAWSAGLAMLESLRHPDAADVRRRLDGPG